MKTFARILIATMAIAVFAAPAAQADPWFRDNGKARVDLRSPDTRDAAERAARSDYRAGADATGSSQPPPVFVTTPGFDWSASAIGAAGMLGLIVLAYGAFAVASRRARPAAS
jgi:hypothetical protein